MFENNALVSTNGRLSATDWNIVDARIDDEANDGNGICLITFANGYVLHLLDVGQSCCESRYLRTDDDLQTLVGSRLVSIRVAQVVEGEYGGDQSHDLAFLKIQTDRVGVTLVTHNEHNGYYSGFTLRAIVKDPSGTKAFDVEIPE